MRLMACALSLVLVTAGCLGADGGAGDESADPITRTADAVDDKTGAVHGLVTDNAITPIGGATVRIVELVDVAATTLPDGRYAIGGVPPGAYTVLVETAGFLPGSQSVQVRAGEVAVLDFLLVRLVSELPYVQEFEHAGYFEYAWGLGTAVSTPAFPNGTWVRDSNCDYSELSAVFDQVGCRGEFPLDAPLESIVFEMVWDAQTPLAESLYVMLRVSDDAAVVTGDTGFVQAEGKSPLTARMDRAELDAVLERFATWCDEGMDQYCGMSFRDRGWPLQTRVWGSWQCPTDQAGFCATIQQKYTQYLTAFYHSPAPAGYSILSGTGAGERADAPPVPASERAPALPGLLGRLLG